MNTLNELDRKVAEAAGWQIIPLPSRIPNYITFQIFNPDGGAVLRETAYATKNEWPDYELDFAIPSFSTDLNAIWSLFIYPVYTQMAGKEMYDYLALPPQEAAFKLCHAYLECLESLKRNEELFP